MRVIKQVDVVCATGAKTYHVGDTVNGLIIANFEIYANEGITEITARDNEKKLVLDIVNCPVVVEYVEI